MPTPSATDRPAKKVAYGALFTALALIFSYIESLLPPFVPVPGIKLGLANAAVTLELYLLGARQAICIHVARIALAALLFGNPMAMLYSLCGAALSMASIALLAKKSALSPVALCAASGAAHNIGQLICAMAVLHSVGLVYYLPALLLGGVLAGMYVGLICAPLIVRIRKVKK